MTWDKNRAKAMDFVSKNCFASFEKPLVYRNFLHKNNFLGIPVYLMSTPNQKNDCCPRKSPLSITILRITSTIFMGIISGTRTHTQQDLGLPPTRSPQFRRLSEMYKCEVQEVVPHTIPESPTIPSNTENVIYIYIHGEKKECEVNFHGFLGNQDLDGYGPTTQVQSNNIMGYHSLKGYKGDITIPETWISSVAGQLIPNN